MSSEATVADGRLLFVATVAPMIEGFLLPLARHFRALGWRVDAMARGVAASRRCVEEFDRVWEIGWERYPLSSSNMHPRTLRRITEVVEMGNYDVVHVHTPIAAFLVRCALRSRSLPSVIYTAHGFHFFRGNRRWRNLAMLALERLASRRTDHLIVINEEDEIAAVRHRLASPGRLHTFPGVGIDMSGYRPEMVPEAAVRRFRNELGVPPGAPLFSMIAEFTPGKRHGDAVTALAHLGRSDVHLAFAGTGRTESSVRRLAVDVGVGHLVHFIGWRNDVQVVIRASTAILLPSEREGLSRIVMESLALEVPVVGTAVRGISDLLRDGGGLLVNVGDVPALSRAMRWVLEHEEQARVVEVNYVGALHVCRVFLPSVVRSDRGRIVLIGSDAARVGVPKETVYALSRRYGVPVRAIIELNALQPPYVLHPGQQVRIPAQRTHVVDKGETVYGISRRYEVSINELVRLNSIDEPFTIVGVARPGE
jgi:glycosyltransferase involved in cell wall biosynthesis